LRLGDYLQRLFQLRGFYRDPQDIDRRNLGRARNGRLKIPECTLQPKLFRICDERLRPDYDGDGIAQMSETRSNQAANPAHTENRVLSHEN
jgi:hypothetical protein